MADGFPVGPLAGSSSLPSYNITPVTLNGWRRGLNNAITGQRSAKILCVGDSTTRGFGAGVDAFGWPGYLAKVLSGRGFSSQRGLVIPEFTRQSQAVDPRIAYGANWAPFSSAGAGGWANLDVLWEGTVAATGMTFTPGVPADRFDIYWLGSTGTGSFQASIDGQAATVINTTSGSQTLGKTTVTTTDGVHANPVLTLNNVTVAPVFVGGIEGQNGVTPAICVGNAGVNASFADNEWNQLSAGHTGPLDWINKYAPDLLLLMLGVNDTVSGFGVGSFTAAMSTIAANSIAAGASVMLMSPIPINPAAGSTSLESQYAQALLSLATSLGCGYVDVFNRWEGPGGYGILNPLGWYFDNIHPSLIGYSDLATTIATALDNA